MSNDVHVVLHKPSRVLSREEAPIRHAIAKYFLTFFGSVMMIATLSGIYSAQKSFIPKTTETKIGLILAIIFLIPALIYWFLDIKEFISRRARKGYNFKSLIKDKLIIEIIIVIVIIFLIVILFNWIFS